MRNRLAWYWLTVALTWGVMLGLTFNGMLYILDAMYVTLAVFGGAALLTIVAHRNEKWRWYRSPFDWVWIMWAAVILISVVANPHTWRRSVESMGYLVLYLGYWYLLTDLIANRRITRQQIVDALLATVLVVGSFVVVQIYNSLFVLRMSYADIFNAAGSVGNVSASSLLSVTVLPFVLWRMVRTKNGLGRVFFGFYLGLLLLIVTAAKARAGYAVWFGTISVLVIVFAADNGYLGIATIRNWWQTAANRVRYSVAGAVVAFLVGGMVLFIYLVIVTFFGESSLLGRETVWPAAFAIFREHPIFGSGLFTYGYHFKTVFPVPPEVQMPHAHSIYFNIMAEMGLFGIAALFMTGLVIARQIWRNWQTMQTERSIWLVGIAALAGILAYHGLDMPSILPIVAITSITMLVMVTTPAEPEPMTAPWRLRGHPIGLAALWVLLIAAGSYNIYWHKEYYANLETALETEAWRTQAEAMERVVNADPRQPAYIWQQAFLYGNAAADGDREAAERAEAAYLRYTELEPFHSLGWANLAAIRYQLDDVAGAQAAIAIALDLSEGWPTYIDQQELYSGITPNDPIEDPGSYVREEDKVSRFEYLREGIGNPYLPQTLWTQADYDALNPPS